MILVTCNGNGVAIVKAIVVVVVGKTNVKLWLLELAHICF